MSDTSSEKGEVDKEFVFLIASSDLLLRATEKCPELAQACGPALDAAKVLLTRLSSPDYSTGKSDAAILSGTTRDLMGVTYQSTRGVSAISKIPVEVLRIFLRMIPDERTTALLPSSLVCRTWNSAVRELIIARRQLIGRVGVDQARRLISGLQLRKLVFGSSTPSFVSRITLHIRVLPCEYVRPLARLVSDSLKYLDVFLPGATQANFLSVLDIFFRQCVYIRMAHLIYPDLGVLAGIQSNAVVQGFKTVTHLNLCCNDGDGHEFLNQLEMPRLEQAIMENVDYGRLGRCAALTHLSILIRQSHKNLALVLDNCPHLRSLKLHYCESEPFTISRGEMVRFARLEELSIRHCEIAPDALPLLAHCTKMRKFSCDRLPDLSFLLKAIGGTLVELCVFDRVSTHLVLCIVENCPKLRYLEFWPWDSREMWRDSDIETLKRELRHLQFLSISGFPLFHRSNLEGDWDY
ncbi:MAG: hypothetical protein SGCHY_004928 [Lobulomycetales sp.]